MRGAQFIVPLLMVSACVAACGQAPLLESGKPDAVVRLNVQAQSGLTQNDFTVLDNHSTAAVVGIREQTPATEPVHAIILLDAVNVRYTELSYERDQVVRFLRANGGKLAVPTGVAILTDKGVEMQKGFTLDGNALASILGKHDIGLRTVTQAAGFWGATERFDISATALRTLSNYGSSLPGRKFLLWVSPGWPLLSGVRVDLDHKQQVSIFSTIMRISNELRTANMTLYAINPLGASEDLLRANYYQEFRKGVARPQDANFGNLALQVLAEQSGGLALQGSTDVASMLARCLQDASSWYEVQVATSAHGDNLPYHHLDVKIDRPGVQARTRDGYYVEQ